MTVFLHPHPQLCKHETGSELCHNHFPAWCFIHKNPVLPSMMGISIPETTHYWPLRKLCILILAPWSLLWFRCGFFLSVEIYGFASNLLPAVFSGVLQSCLCCHLSYFHRPAYLFLVTNVKHHSPGIEFSWRISQRSLPLNLK